MVSRSKTEGLTPRQEEILLWVKEFIAKHGMPPTVREIGKAFDMKSSSAFYLLKMLQDKGYIKRGTLGVRSLIMKQAARVMPTMKEVDEEERKRRPKDYSPIPIVGDIAAGPAMLAEENIVGETFIEARTARSGKCFALNVTGDSMIRAGINDGDLIIVRQQPIAESGDVVVALLGDQATVKRLYIKGERIELRPENPKYMPISISADDDLRVLGKVIFVKRRKADKLNLWEENNA